MNTCGERQLCGGDGNDTSFKGWRSEVSSAEAPRDVADFKHIYQLHSRDVYSFCLQMVANRADAENLMEGAFLNVFRRVDTYHYDATLATLLYRFVITALWMQFREDQRRCDSSLRNEANLHGQDCDVRVVKRAPPMVSTSTIERRHLQRAIVQLPLDLRAVFVLHDVLGYEHSKVAQILQFSPHTSRSQLHKARLRLRECLWGGTEKPVPHEETHFTKQRRELGECGLGLEIQREEMRRHTRD